MPLLRKKTFDLLLDLMMPIMGGQDTLRWIRQTPSLQELQVVVLSGENDAYQVKEIVTLGQERGLAARIGSDVFEVVARRDA